MKYKDLIVVFDTNSYRNFVTDEATKLTLEENKVRLNIEQLVNKEKSYNIKACLSPIVVMELFSHLADPNDPDYENCKMALLAANMHCADINHQPRILMDSEIQMCNALFGILPKDRNYDLQIKICMMTYELYNDCNETNMAKWRHNFKSLLDNVNLKEEEFLTRAKVDVFSDMFSSERSDTEQKEYRKSILNKIRSGQQLEETALGQLQRVLDRLGKSINDFTDKEKNEYVATIKEKFIVPLRFYDNFLLAILNSKGKINLGDKSKGNFFWDFNILFYVGDFTFDGKDTILITDDTKMINSAKESGFEHKVLKLNKYIEILF